MARLPAAAAAPTRVWADGDLARMYLGLPEAERVRIIGRMNGEQVTALRDDVYALNRQDLTTWCCTALAPEKQVPARHHRLLIKELEMIASGENDRLMITMPPGHGKSRYASQLFVAWFLAQAPYLCVIGASAGSDLAVAFSRRVLDLVRDFGQVLGYSLRSEAAQSWLTSNNGEYFAAGVGTKIAGRRADCLTGDTEVLTLGGLCRIKNVEVGTATGYVLSYVEEKTSCSFQRIRGIVGRKARSIWIIRTASGRVVEATGNHRFYTARGWIAASALVVGDVLLSAVREGESADGGPRSGFGAGGALNEVLQHKVCSDGDGAGAIHASLGGILPALRERDTPRERGLGESNQERSRDILQPVVLDGRSEYREGHAAEDLPQVWRVNGRCVENANDVLGSLPGGGNPGGSGGSEDADPAAAMRVVRHDIHPQDPCGEGRVLQPEVRQRGALGQDQGHQQPRLAGRHVLAAGEHAPVLQGKGPDMGPGQDAVRGVLVGLSSRRSPHQHDPIGQPVGKFGYALPQLSPEVPCGGAFKAESDPVSLVECLRRECDVYDIQVEGTECFFANGVLVHNCAIIDDPFGKKEDADSSEYRERVWQWFQTDFLTRLKPNGRIILINTRWHEDDLSGRLLDAEPDRWRVVNLPAIAEEDDALGRDPGEALWPEQFPLAKLLELQRGYGGEDSRTWTSLYQQRPAPAGGALFMVDKIGVVDVLPPIVRRVRAWDLAATEAGAVTRGGKNNDPDWTVGLLLARTVKGTWIIEDVIRFRGRPQEVEDRIVSTAQKDGVGVLISLPKDPGQAGKSQIAYLARQLAGFNVTSSPESGSKATRAMPVASQVEAGNLSMLRAEWNLPLINELRMFPAGRNDDQTDALSRAFGELVVAGVAARAMSIGWGAR